jgi:2'-5' RNA ligase
MRLFVGIPLAAPVVRELTAASARLRSDGDGLRWSKPESWHITLQYLGNTEPGRYECVVARLGELCLSPVPIWLEGLGCFDRAGVLFAEVRPTPELLLLQRRVTQATEACGFPVDARPYQPHITLARSKGNSKGKGRAQGLSALKTRARAAQNFTQFVAGEFLLYESLPGPSGVDYAIRARFPLGG